MQQVSNSRSAKLAFAAALLLFGLITQSVRAASGELPSEQDCLDFGRLIEKSLATNANFLLQHVNWNEMLCRGITNLNAPKDIETNFFTSFKKSAEVLEFGKMFSKTNCKFLRILPVNDEPRPLFRLLRPDGGVEYQEFVVERFGNDLKIVDVYFLNDGKSKWWHTGELFSETARRNFLPSLTILKKGFFARLLGQQNESLKYVSEQMEFSRLALDKKFKEAMKIHGDLPPTIQKQRDMLVVRALGAMLADDKDGQTAALAAWEENFPGDPALDLAVASTAIRNKNHLGAIEPLTHLNDALGGDAHLNLMKVAQYEAIHDPEKALDCAKRAVNREPGSMVAQIKLLECLLEMENFSEAGQALISIHLNMSEDATHSISQHPKYARFTQSEGFKQWLAYRNPPKITAPLPAPTAAKATVPPSIGGKGPIATLTPKPPAETLKLQGITIRGERSSAMINGATLFLGEEINLYTITKIEPDKVTLQSRNGKEKVLSLKEIFTR